MYAFAIDLGTTTLAVSLVDAAHGRRLAMTGAMNPQRRFGADVVTRLDAAVQSPENLREMSLLIRSELLRLAREVCNRASVDWDSIQQAAIAGNPAMQHILLGLPVRSLAFPPYRPLQTGGQLVSAAQLGWPGTFEVYLFPMPGGFVGGDTVAFLYGQLEGQVEAEVKVKNDSSTSTFTSTLFLDMGTNGEMALMADDTLWSTSAAAGPAFEGGNLSCGMAALPGAISSVRIDGERLKLAVIGDTVPVGICGSGAIEAVHELLGQGIIDPTGRLLDSREIASNLANRLVTHNGENAFVLHRDARNRLMLTQGDIRQIQLAKSAIRAGMEVLACKARIRCEALKEVVLTGSFGAVLQPEWLKTIGIFDEGMVHITRFTPEGALAGAEKVLCTGSGICSVEELAGRLRVVPLSGTPLFEELFLQHMDFPRP
jgi:uncharacterized 2Fe-2S/4Fe-4S cluster protein (DUF4445 family)